jgi:hypothetical protein
MTSRTAVAAPPQGEHWIPSQPRASQLPTHQRRSGMIAVAVLLIAAGAFGGLQLVATSNNKVSALVLVQEVPAGHVITSTDLGGVSLSGKVAYIPSSAESSVVGSTAARDLFAGQLLTHSMTTAVTVPDATHALVGLQLKADQVPSAGLNDGDPVELVEQQSVANGTSPSVPLSASSSSPADGGATGTDSSSAMVVVTGTVYAMSADANSSGGALVTVLVPRAGSEQLSIAASVGQVSLIRVGP